MINNIKQEQWKRAEDDAIAQWFNILALELMSYSNKTTALAGCSVCMHKYKINYW